MFQFLNECLTIQLRTIMVLHLLFWHVLFHHILLHLSLTMDHLDCPNSSLEFHMPQHQFIGYLSLKMQCNVGTTSFTWIGLSMPCLGISSSAARGWWIVSVRMVR
uniref:Uncharacterized protein n=1 Tax=Hordeum vulgare subsp. vulgare TaxID=112509 RepID=A0A8I6YLC2_HORVV